MNKPAYPYWMKTVLLLAAGYNILWGIQAVLFPSLQFDLLGMAQPNYPFLWQCIGMIVGVYGLGYAIAAFNPLQHWPIVLVGLLGKIFGPIGFVWTYFQGGIPGAFGYTIITNDLIWWIPFGLILVAAASNAQAPSPSARPLRELIWEARSSNGRTLLELSSDQDLLVVFLRHAGCTFCREALGDLKRLRPSLKDKGLSLALVHMSPPESFAHFVAQYEMQDIPAFSDPSQQLYQAFELNRGSLWQLFGPKVWLGGLRAMSHGVGKLAGDGFQMPGAFVVRNGEIVKAFRHRSAADRPDYCELPPVTESR
jgi:hypothetical protein